MGGAASRRYRSGRGCYQEVQKWEGLLPGGIEVGGAATRRYRSGRGCYQEVQKWEGLLPGGTEVGEATTVGTEVGGAAIRNQNVVLGGVNSGKERGRGEGDVTLVGFGEEGSLEVLACSLFSNGPTTWAVWDREGDDKGGGSRLYQTERLFPFSSTSSLHCGTDCFV